MAAVAGLVLGLLVPGVQAQTVWQGGTGDWTDAGNWSGGVPDGFTDGHIDNGGTAQIQAPGAESQILYVGEGNSGSLAIGAGGTLTTETGSVGHDAAGTGGVTLDGAGANWTTTDIYVGGNGTGTLTVGHGAVLDSAIAAIGVGQDGEGTVIVSGTGSTWSNWLNFYVGLEGKGTLTVENGGTVESASSFLGGDTGGEGTATVTGAGSLWNAGLLSVGDVATGTLTIENGGTVESELAAIGTCDCATGTVVVRGAGSTWTNNQLLSVGESGAGTLTIADGGRVDVGGTGAIEVLDLGFFNTASGTLNIGEGGVAGILNAAGVTGGDGTAVVNFNHSDSAYDFANLAGTAIAIAGGAAVNHIGAGTTILRGIHSYTGATTVSAGTLRIDGTIASPVTIGVAGTLGGIGSILGDIAAHGRLAPGSSIGTLSVTGDVTFGAGSTFVVEVNAAGESDLLAVTGAADLTGAQVQVVPLLDGFRLETDYTILTATDAITTTFAGVSSTSAFLDPELAYEPNAVTLRLTRNATTFDSIAEAGNQSGVGGALDSVGGSASGDLSTIINALLPLSTGEAQAALDQLAGSSHTAAPATQLMNHAQFDAAVQAAALRHSGGAGPRADFAAHTLLTMASAEDLGLDRMPELGRLLGAFGPTLNAAPSADRERPGVWVSGYGFAGRVHGDDSNADGFVHRTGGALAGADWHVREDTVVGVALGYARSEIEQANGGAETLIDNGHASLYGVWRPAAADGRLALDGAVGVGLSEFRSERRLAFGGLERTAEGERGGWDFALRGGLSQRFDVEDWQLTPLAGLTFTRLHQAGYTETGAGAANLVVPAQTIHSLQSRLGIEVGREFLAEDGIRWRPATSVRWRHEFADTGRGMDVALAGVPDAGFRTTGPSAARNALELDAGLSATAGDTTYSLIYAGSFDSGETAHGLFADIRFTW